MADYTNIQNANLEPDAPALSSTVFALRDNPIAIAEGAAGAPRIVNAAIAKGQLTVNRLNVVAAGATARFFAASETTTTNSSYIGAVTAVVLANAGSIRVSFDHRSVFASSTVESRVLRNDTVIATWQTSSTSYITRSVDFSISRGDQVSIQHRTVSGSAPESAIRNRAIRTSGGDLWPLPSEFFIFGDPA